MSSTRIGVAYGPIHNGRQNTYAVYRVNVDATVTVEHTGHREGTTMVGLPLGGPGWRPPTRFDSDIDHFVEITFLRHCGEMPSHIGSRAMAGIDQATDSDGVRVRECTGRYGTLDGPHSTYGATVRWDDGSRFYVDSACLWRVPSAL